jgi:hypothetical protein
MQQVIGPPTGGRTLVHADLDNQPIFGCLEVEFLGSRFVGQQLRRSQQFFVPSVRNVVLGI